MVIKTRHIFAIQMWGSSHLLINLTNLTLGVRKFPRLSDTILFGMVPKVYVCYPPPNPLL